MSCLDLSSPYSGELCRRSNNLKAEQNLFFFFCFYAHVNYAEWKKLVNKAVSKWYDSLWWDVAFLSLSWKMSSVSSSRHHVDQNHNRLPLFVKQEARNIPYHCKEASLLSFFRCLQGLIGFLWMRIFAYTSTLTAQCLSFVYNNSGGLWLNGLSIIAKVACLHYSSNTDCKRDTTPWGVSFH